MPRDDLDRGLLERYTVTLWPGTTGNIWAPGVTGHRLILRRIMATCKTITGGESTTCSLWWHIGDPAIVTDAAPEKDGFLVRFPLPMPGATGTDHVIIELDDDYGPPTDSTIGVTIGSTTAGTEEWDLTLLRSHLVP